MALKQALTPEFRLYQRQVVANCRVLAQTLMELGYRVVTGTDRIPGHAPLLPGVALKPRPRLLGSPGEHASLVLSTSFLSSSPLSSAPVRKKALEISGGTATFKVPWVTLCQTWMCTQSPRRPVKSAGLTRRVTRLLGDAGVKRTWPWAEFDQTPCGYRQLAAAPGAPGASRGSQERRLPLPELPGLPAPLVHSVLRTQCRWLKQITVTRKPEFVITCSVPGVGRGYGWHRTETSQEPSELRLLFSFLLFFSIF